jgi:SPP1 family predicted phage head-tail adaptor
MTPAGKYTERVGFERKGTLFDGAGGTTTEWAPQFETWAAAMHLRGGEAVQAARLDGRHPVVFRVRRSTATRQIAPDWRLRDLRTGTLYAIRDITMPGDDRDHIDILAEGGAAQ